MATPDLTPGSIAEISQRLALWARRTPKGLARVEYSSEFARQHTLQELAQLLTPVAMPVHDLVLPLSQSPDDLVLWLLDQLRQVDAGVVSVSGFATAFSTQVPLPDALRVLNFNRERFVAFPLKQIWWMTPMFLQTAIHAMPDLNSWFSPRLHLTEVILNPAHPVAAHPLTRDPASDPAIHNLADARHRAQQLVHRFLEAGKSGASDLERLKTYLLPALTALADAGAQKDLHDLTSQFEGLLGQLKTTHTPELASSLDRLATVYQKQGRYSEAEPLFLRALQLRERQLGKNHSDVAASLNNLAELYRAQGRYGEAEPCLQRSLQIRQKQLGEDHLDVANSFNNLAALYQSQGRYREAEPLYQQSLAIRQKQLGEDHLDVATSLNNLAALYYAQGRYSEAEPFYQQSLAIRQKQLGEDHLDVATSLNNLAALYQSQGRYSEAELLYQRSLQILQKQLGYDHPDVANSLNNLAALYYSQRHYSQAESLLQRSLQILQKRLGKNHPTTQLVQENLDACRREAAPENFTLD